MSTMNIICPICKSSYQREELVHYDDRFGSPGLFDLCSCKDCGHWYLKSPIDDAELGQLYKTYYPRQDFDLESYRPHRQLKGLAAWFNGELANAHRWVPPKVRVLDIGCGACETLGYHKNAGSSPVGVEVDENIAPIALHYGFDVRFGVFSKALFRSDESFDFITLAQVIEHVHNPISTLRDAAELLAPGGRIVVTTPNVSSWGRRLFRRRWINWHIPYHCQFFTARSMTLAAKAAGLTVCSRRTITSSEWLYYQWLHLATCPTEGTPSLFWGGGEAVPSLLERVIHKTHRFKVNHIVTRLFDSIGMGDNQVFVFTKTE